MGRHLNRVRLHNVNGAFLEPISLTDAEWLLDSGAAMRLSRLKERPVRIKLLASRPTQPRAGSGCTSPASITAADMEAAVGITKGLGGVNWNPPSYSPQSHLFYVANKELCQVFDIDEQAPPHRPGGPRLRDTASKLRCKRSRV